MDASMKFGSRNLPPFRADHVGSLLRPRELAEARASCGAGTMESKDELKRRIDQAAKYLPLEQLALSLQCGFASTEEGNLLTEAEQWAKLRLCVEMAREVWGGVQGT